MLSRGRGRRDVCGVWQRAVKTMGVREHCLSEERMRDQRLPSVLLWEYGDLQRALFSPTALVLILLWGEGSGEAVFAGDWPEYASGFFSIGMKDVLSWRDGIDGGGEVRSSACPPVWGIWSPWFYFLYWGNLLSALVSSNTAELFFSSGPDAAGVLGGYSTSSVGSWAPVKLQRWKQRSCLERLEGRWKPVKPALLGPVFCLKACLSLYHLAEAKLCRRTCNRLCLHFKVCPKDIGSNHVYFCGVGSK
ncbi:uncharacterized protein LOC128072470 isoform X2 [Tympanuchus pallidicinctus]|uniref:uncharacterized protein LOC128072470 isoform X2 n=1 Tax=Tympanuchus pallidicinctus TaxID=109042 RepID=UPI0022871EE1|nr:uncharacterized protein LOC128072470 isoform X2 [Tympanuchus pallidicinctus]